jgi:hypothetical protein
MITSAVATSSVKSSGAWVATVLKGSWRSCPPDIDVSADELKQIIPLLLSSGAGGLAWWRVRQSDLRSPEIFKLQQAYRQHSIYSAIHEQRIQRVIGLLHSAGVVPLLVKGWAVARLYPEAGMRPYGDIDLCLHPHHHRAALAALKGTEFDNITVDLHVSSKKLDDCSLEELFERSNTVKFGDVEVRVLGLEDQLRILSVHFLRHGAWRPLWLCDIAAAVESRPLGFDWDRCLGRNCRRADWVACAIGLAHRLLGVKIDDTPAAERGKHLPSWLVPTVLREWGKQYRHRIHMELFVRQPLNGLKELPHHWPNAIEATINVRGPFNALPRLPFQIGDSFLRAARFLPQILSASRKSQQLF